MTDAKAVARELYRRVTAPCHYPSDPMDEKEARIELIREALEAERNEIACLKNKIIELEANTASLLDAREREVWTDVENFALAQKTALKRNDLNRAHNDVLDIVINWCRRQGGGG